MESEKAFLERQKSRLERRITYSRRIIRSGRIDAKFKQMRILPSQVKALERLNSGHYLKCSTCPQKIERERLEQIPGAIRCIDCQRRYEGKKK